MALDLVEFEIEAKPSEVGTALGACAEMPTFILSEVGAFFL